MNPHDFESLPAEEHPQPSLITFYWGARIYLVLEIISAITWVAQMFAFKFGIATLAGAQYRLANTLLLFHLGTPLAMVNVVQQTRNNNSVMWWIFIVFFMGLAGDTESLMEVASRNLSQDVFWAWLFYLLLAIYNVSLTFFAIIWFVVWFYIKTPEDIPIPAALTQFWKAQGKDVKKMRLPVKYTLSSKLLH